MEKSFRRMALKGKMLETVVRRCSLEKVFLEISQNSQENACARVSFFIKGDFGAGVFL